MVEMLWCVVGILVLIIILLLVKIHLLQRSAKEIEEAFADRLVTDTNTLIDISSRDKYMRSLANSMNVQLRLLRSERRRFQQGDKELKNAVTNISHDLRTPLTAICGYLDLLEQEEKSEIVKRYLEVIKERTEMLMQLTETGKVIFANMAAGLDEVQVGKLFDRFYTVEVARKSTGLGLAIARTLLEQMGGTISAQYEHGRLCISIQLPNE